MRAAIPRQTYAAQLLRGELSNSLRGALRSSSLEQLALSRVLRQQSGARELSTCFIETAELSQEVAPDRR